MRVFTLTLFSLTLSLTTALAQPPAEGRRSRGESTDERGGRGDRGGFGRGGGGGGFPGGGGDFGGRGFGGGGGFPGGGGGGFGGGGGGFGGGGFGGGGFPGGGRGGDRGGFQGGGRGGGGGFDPSDMIRRFDRNGNNMIDPDEAQGPAQFFLQRMAENNPKIDLSKPVPIDLLTGEMDRMRGGGDSEDDAAADGPTLLVPDFTLSSTPTPVAGFGASSEKFMVKVTDRDTKEAEERLRRYDQNRDGVLTEDEVRRGRWPDDPMQFDRNRDGKLTVAELAIRSANRRIEETASRDANNDPRNARRGQYDDGWMQSEDRRGEEEVESRFGDAKSYRMISQQEAVNSIKGLPDFFARSDANADGQVLMSEFSNSWNEETLKEFQKWDLNNDGIITAQECLMAVRNSGAKSSSSSSTSSSSASAPAASKSAPAASGGGAPDKTHIEWATKQIAKYDTNNDNQLTADEWEKMIIKPVGADLNGDGVITIEEYATFRAK